VLIGTILKLLKKILSVETYETIVQETFGVLIGKHKVADCFEAFSDMLIRMMTGKEDPCIFTHDKADYIQVLKPKKDDGKGQR
jgi:hypothetical protein